MDTSSIDSLLGQLSAAAARMKAPLASNKSEKSVASADFGAALARSLDAINANQLDATRRARDFELGAPEANLNDVMISMQKANLSFQQLVQVRNRLVSAYHDIMNMQV